MEAESTSPKRETSNTVALGGGNMPPTSDISPQNSASTNSSNGDTNTSDRTDISAEVVGHSIKCNCVAEQHENTSPFDAESVVSMAGSFQSFTILADSPQTSFRRKCCLRQRLWSVLDNEDLSDVVFIVGQDGQQQRIPAHRVILSVASDVFKATFSRAESAVTPETTYHIPDVAPAAFMTLLRFFYLDEVLITSDTAISTLYVARKYGVQSLEDHCVNFLIKNLCLDNAVTILNQVMMFNIKRLINACLEMIEGDTIAAVAAEGFDNIDAKTLCLLLESDSLTISEIQLFQAVIRWSKAECLRKNLTVDQENQRSVLKDALPLLRFPLMPVDEFSSIVTRSGLLTKNELLSMYLYFTEKPTPAVSFKTTPRFWEKTTPNRFKNFEFGCACSNTLNYIDTMDEETVPLREKFKILLVGSSGVGKTSLAVRYKDGEFDSSLKCTSAIESISLEANICEEDITLKIMDATGQPEKFGICLSNYYASADGVILVYDVTNQESFTAADSMLSEFDTRANKRVRKMLLGNKTDKEKREVNAEEGKKLAEKYGAAFMETSAKKNDNVKIAFEYLTQQVYLNSESWQLKKYKTLCQMRQQTLPQFKIFLFGDSNVGKTCLLKRYVKDTFTLQTCATIGVECYLKSYEVGDDPVKFNFWDTSGNERFVSHLRQYYHSAIGAVLVYDVTDLESFHALDYWINEQHCHFDTEHAKKIIVGNKTDKEPRAVSAESAREFARKNGAAYIETSAKDDSNIAIAFEYIVQQVLLCPDLWKEVNRSGEN